MLQASFEGPAQRYRRTLAQLDVLIAWAEGDVERCAAAAGRLTGAGRNPGPARTRLRMAERRLALLRQSREYQLQGDPLPLIDAPH